MKKKDCFNSIRFFLLGTLMLSSSSCMMKAMEIQGGFIDRTVALSMDFILIAILFIGVLGSLTALLHKRAKGRKEALTSLPFAPLFPLAVYFFIFWNQLFTKDFYKSYFTLLFSFERPIYSVVIFLTPLPAFIFSIQVILVNRKKKSENGGKKVQKKVAKSSNEPGIDDRNDLSKIRMSPRKDLFPDYFRSFERLHNVLGYTHADQELKLENGLTFYQRGAREETREVAVFQNGEQTMQRREFFYAILAANSKSDALKILKMLPCQIKAFEYVIVETPEGNWGRDIDGIYEVD